MTKPPNPLEPGHITGQNPNTPERLPGHTEFAEGANNANEDTLGGRPAFLFTSGDEAAITLDQSGANLPDPSTGEPWTLERYMTLGIRDAATLDRSPEIIIRGILARGYYVWNRSTPTTGEGTGQ